MAAQPWNEIAMREALLHAMMKVPRVRLSDLDADQEPGAYLQFLDAPHLTPIFGVQIATGILPSYAGAAKHSSRRRLGCYRQSIDEMGALRLDQVHIALLPLESSASAAFAEQALIDEFPPPLNGTGWGANVPGSGRPGRQCSIIDSVLPGRNWALSPTDADQAIALAQLIACSARHPRSSHRWPALKHQP